MRMMLRVIVNRYGGCIQVWVGVGLTVSRSTLSLRQNKILSTSYHCSPSLSLLSPVPRLCCCRLIHIPVSLSLISSFFRISAAAIARRLSPPLNLSAITILSRIYSASSIILLYIWCGLHCIIFHCRTSFKAVISFCVSCIYFSHFFFFLSISLSFYLISCIASDITLLMTCCPLPFPHLSINPLSISISIY